MNYFSADFLSCGACVGCEMVAEAWCDISASNIVQSIGRAPNSRREQQKKCVHREIARVLSHDVALEPRGSK